MERQELRLRAYAKINLYLGIRGKLPDGMHELDMLMRMIDLSDGITLKKADSIGISGMEGLSFEKNIACRAAKLFFTETGIAGGVQIHIEKNIPLMSGMGGGSADAAAVLLGLDILYETSLGIEKLMQMGKKIGSDVPFMLFGGCARAGGIGEKLVPVADRLDAVYLIAKPHGGIMTADCFRLYDSLPKSGEKGDIGVCIRALAAGDAELFAKNSKNDLEAPAKILLPEIGHLLEKIGRSADFSFMTGSGSTCVGLFLEKSRAEEALEQIKGECAFACLAGSAEKISYA